jgi:hypothetical protein
VTFGWICLCNNSIRLGEGRRGGSGEREREKRKKKIWSPQRKNLFKMHPYRRKFQSKEEEVEVNGTTDKVAKSDNIEEKCGYSEPLDQLLNIIIEEFRHHLYRVGKVGDTEKEMMQRYHEANLNQMKLMFEAKCRFV